MGIESTGAGTGNGADGGDGEVCLLSVLFEDLPKQKTGLCRRAPPEVASSPAPERSVSLLLPETR